MVKLDLHSMSLFNKVKCFFGFHTWDYSLGEIYDKYKISKDRKKIVLDTSYYPVRFCPRCYKKQLRHRHDMRIIWLDTELSSQVRRSKQLNKLLDKT
jgi:hypothetical protein